MSRKKILISVLTVILNLCSCTVTKKYTDSLVSKRIAYCSNSADSFARKLVIKAIQTEFVGYPDQGICFGVEE